MRSRNEKKGIMSEINITPFTDVVLVLLIIFMVATPLIYQSRIKINLPKAGTGQTDEVPQRITILIDKQGDAYLDNVHFILPGDEKKLISSVSASVGTNMDAIVVINGDRDGKYDYVVRVIDAVKSIGIKRIMLGTEAKK